MAAGETVAAEGEPTELVVPEPVSGADTPSGSETVVPLDASSAPEAAPEAAVRDLSVSIPGDPGSAQLEPEQFHDRAEPGAPRVLRLVPPLPASTATPAPGDRPETTGPETTGPEADLAVLSALGLVDPAADSAPALAASGVDSRGPAPEEPPGPARPIRFRVARSDRSVVPGAAVSLLDERGRDIATGYADEQGAGELWAPHPGTYLLLSAAPDHQPGATTVSVLDEPADAELLMLRSAVLTGSVRAPHGPVVAARLTLVQDGEVVDATRSDSAGAYRLADLAAGSYGLSVAAPGCVPLAVRIDLSTGAELNRDLELARDGEVERRTIAEPERDPELDVVTGSVPEQATADSRQVVVNR